MDEPAGFRPYDPDPRLPLGVPPGAAGSGYAALVAAVGRRLRQRPPSKRAVRVVAVDLYQAPGMDPFLERFREAWESEHGPASWLDTRMALKAPDLLSRELDEFLTDDPVFGRVCDRDLSLFFDPERWHQLVQTVERARRTGQQGHLFVVGPGALLPALRPYADVALYAQAAREALLFGSEAGVGRNLGDDRDRGRWGRYKRSFYVDWPVQNRHLFGVLPACDLLVDMHDPATPAFADVPALLAGMTSAAERPFRVRSVFVPGVWGGHRLQRLVPGLPADWPNCAWGFEVVAPENAVTFEVGRTPLQVSFELFLHFQARRILGPDNHRRFGAFFPIRFDFLDTIEGSNLSCQVHPPDGYISAHFREPFAQHETYYILEARPGAKVYLGLREGTSREAFLSDVTRAEADQVPFDITSHVSAWDSSPGDLFLIPAGTVHCSGADNLVLEISAAPYLYTFKIYDYLRPDLDGAPRPISYQRAFEVIDFSRRTDWVRQNLLARPRLLGHGPGWRRLLLADSDLLFFGIERVEMTGTYRDTTEEQGVHVLCVIGGKGTRAVREADGSALDLSYAETGIVPGACGPYRLEPIGDAEVHVVKCYVRT